MTITLNGTTGITTPALTNEGGLAGTTGTFSGLISANGGQIKFPASQSASSDANTLDDYEEGTWTPTLTITNSSTGITYTSRGGTYTKIGNLVRISFGVQLSNKGANTGALNITGIPFMPYEGSGGARNIGSIAFEGSMTSFPAACVWGLAYSDNQLYFRYQTTSGYGDIQGSQITNSTIIYGTFTYMTT